MYLSRRHFLAVSLTAAAGCTRSPGNASDILMWGKEGLRDGHFLRPRAIGVHNGEVYAIDTTGRIQVFTPEGAFTRLWSTPDASNGTPTGITFTADRVFVPDTHYSRILEYTPDGEMLGNWGSYGTNTGEFVYPTDIARDDAGRMIIAEYGEDAHRIQVFDEDRNFAGLWGTFGEAPGAFNRAMAVDRDSRGLFHVADTGNHRLQTLDAKGNALRIVGGADSGPGALEYPFDLAVTPDDTVLVADYGRNQILRYDPDGAFVAAFGGPGRKPGEFNGPRGIAVSPDNMVYVTDTDNHRIQRFPLESVA